MIENQNNARSINNVVPHAWAEFFDVHVYDISKPRQVPRGDNVQTRIVC